MSGIVDSFRSFEGRIARKGFWLGVLVLALLAIVLTLLLAPLMSGDFLQRAMILFEQPDYDGAEASALMLEAAQRGAWASLVVNLIIGYPALALMVKRRHDRNSSGADAIVLYALTLLGLALQSVGIGNEIVAFEDGLVVAPTLPLIALNIVTGLLGLYLFIVMGFLKGTAGPNRYGPDPLAPTQQDAR
ncbi:DUF805 domain-containing protein [Arsenicitalea aurantiaca]|nr:DUF805 domain-containing protein [Arsenicitalea aurantiaca]